MKTKPKNITQTEWDEMDSPPLSDDILVRMRPVKETHPEIPRRVRGVQKSPTKVPVSIRLSSEVVDYFKAQGKGWQTRVDDILQEFVNSHQ